MGLDMSLYRRQYAHPGFGSGVLKIAGKEGVEEVKVRNWSILNEEIGCWRKANQIHGWFVRNVQDGEDDCKEYEVSREQLAKLLETVRHVLSNIELVDGQVANGATLVQGKWVKHMMPGKVVKDPKIAISFLPTYEGFFFGSYDYDEYYVEDLRETELILSKALSLPTETTFSYQSSW